eukprot:1264911-Amphidinium_carterae.1
MIGTARKWCINKLDTMCCAKCKRILAVSDAAAVDRCSRTKDGAPSGSGASDQAVARMPTNLKCKPRVSAHAEPQSAFGRFDAKIGVSKRIFECLPRRGCIAGMYCEDCVIDVSTQVRVWRHVRRCQVCASQESKGKQGGGQRVSLNEASVGCMQGLVISSEPRCARRSDVPREEVLMFQAIEAKGVSQKRTINAWKRVLEVHLDRAVLRMLPHRFAHRINKLGG